MAVLSASVHALRSGAGFLPRYVQRYVEWYLQSCLWLVALLLCPCAEVWAQDESAALQIKAAFVHKFADYVQGPGTDFENSATPLIFGVSGSPEVLAYLTQLVAAQGTSVRAAQVRSVVGAADLTDIDILFIGRETGAELAAELLRQALTTSTLTVTDSTGAQPPGSMIHFFIENDRVRFDIALTPLQQAGLRLSSRLLQIARRVSGNASP